jgi:hypothetical protein
VISNTARDEPSWILEAPEPSITAVGLSSRRSLVRKLTLALALVGVWTLSGCKKTGEGQYEIEKPVIGTETDTVNTPTLETGTVKDTISVPKVETEKKEVTVPKVEVNRANE